MFTALRTHGIKLRCSAASTYTIPQENSVVEIQVRPPIRREPGSAFVAWSQLTFGEVRSMTTHRRDIPSANVTPDVIAGCSSQDEALRKQASLSLLDAIAEALRTHEAVRVARRSLRRELLQ